jgi:hypothetical protein
VPQQRVGGQQGDQSGDDFALARGAFGGAGHGCGFKLLVDPASGMPQTGRRLTLIVTNCISVTQGPGWAQSVTVIAAL